MEDQPLEEAAMGYLKTNFAIDLLALLPFGGVLSELDYRFRTLWLLKVLRLNELYYYTSMRFFTPLINSFIEIR